MGGSGAAINTTANNSSDEIFTRKGKREKKRKWQRFGFEFDAVVRFQIVAFHTSWFHYFIIFFVAAVSSSRLKVASTCKRYY